MFLKQTKMLEKEPKNDIYLFFELSTYSSVFLDPEKELLKVFLADLINTVRNLDQIII